MKQTLAAGLLLILLLFLPPWLRWLNGSGEEASRSPAQEKQETEKEQEEGGSSDAVHTMRLWDGETTQTMPVGEYLLGVVRGEMPAAFEAEALMAQAVAERTYLYYAMAAAPKKNHPDADVCTDPGCCTAWLGEAEARENGETNFSSTRIRSAPLWPIPTGRWFYMAARPLWRCSTPPQPEPRRTAAMSGRRSCPILSA